MTEKKTDKTFDIVGRVVDLLEGLDEESQIHVLKTVNIWLKINEYVTFHDRTIPEKRGISIFPESHPKAEGAKFSDRQVMSPKDFLIEKAPRTEVERVACLAYYLMHYQDMPHFRNVDISKINTEAAQQKFTNPAQSVKNATISGLLATVSRGKKQLSAMGEQFVQALPDREESRAFLRRKRKARAKRKTSKRKRSSDVGS